jgi:hypothetical protein
MLFHSECKKNSLRRLAALVPVKLEIAGAIKDGGRSADDIELDSSQRYPD